MADATPMRAPEGATGVLVLVSGDVVWGRGFGAEGEAVGEVCFHTAITGYQEIMTDPSFEGQIITFTFPHIGNVGANHEDVEANHAHALGCIVREDVTAPSNFRAAEGFDAWLKARALGFGRVRCGGSAREGAGLAGAGGDGPGQAGVVRGAPFVGRRGVEAGVRV
jgi:carbamoyl-phosphate synthase small subunit